MDDPLVTVQLRRTIEDRAGELRKERLDLNRRLLANTKAIAELLPQVEGTGLPMGYLAYILGVSRQTLYRWKENTSAKAGGGSD